MKFNKWTLGLAAVAASFLMAASASGQSIASGVAGGTSGIANVPTTLATATQTNLPLAQGTSIDLRVNRNVAFDLSFNGSSAATNAAVTATFAPSMDGTTYDTSKTFSLAVTGLGATVARGSTNFDSVGYPFVIPISITNAIGVTVSNLTVRYATKNGS